MKKKKKVKKYKIPASEKEHQEKYHTKYEEEPLIKGKSKYEEEML